MQDQIPRWFIVRIFMSNLKLPFAVGWLLFFVSAVSAAQDYSARLDTVLEQIKTHLSEQKPEYKHRSVEPMGGSKNVSVNNWEFDGQIVRVSILAYASANEAAEAMRKFSSETRTLDRFPELGDVGYSWGMGGSNICFRKGDVTVWISTSSTRATNLKQSVKIVQEFATLVAAAIPAV